MAWSGATVGSWACTAGGWDSSTPRSTSETFIVLEGRGAVTDMDGARHEFGPGDTVILPKHWCGRWDVSERIHKVWMVHSHPDVPGAAIDIVRAVVVPLEIFFDASLQAAAEAKPHALHGSPRAASRTVYSVGPTKVGCWSCSPGSFVASSQRATTEAFHLIEGVLFLTNTDGSARRCVAGDTVVLPKGWCGHWDIIEPAKKVWVDVGEGDAEMVPVML